MSYQVLARKWRPSKFNELVGQEHVGRLLKNSIANESIAHAYLFTGTRGVGKTTAARIFSKTLMCSNLQDGEPCLECESCLSVDQNTSMDYVEIDGASNELIVSSRF